MLNHPVACHNISINSLKLLSQRPHLLHGQKRCTHKETPLRMYFEYLFWLIAVPFRERNEHLIWTASDLSIAFQAWLYRFIMWRFRWNYPSIFNIYFTTSSRLFLYLIMAYFPKQVEITKLHRWFCAYERNNISRYASPSFARSVRMEMSSTKENQQLDRRTERR